MSKKFRIAGINFDHFHMGDMLRMVYEHPDAELVAICDAQPARMREAQRNFAIPDGRIFTDVEACMEKARPDVVILCPAAASHGEYVARVAKFGVHVMVEKPFAASLAESDAMVAAMPAGKLLAINWPLRWAECCVTAKRIIDEGVIGEVRGFHHYGGNRGPLHHGADKIEKEPTAAEKSASWFYSKSAGGGSLLDYLGYGTTIGTWFMGGRVPLEVTCVTDEPPGLEVDEHSVVV
ncbi:MAG: Gfo/Idh/MocA family oxidoreductase, partial [Chthoniobacteraceae bacterium]